MNDLCARISLLRGVTKAAYLAHPMVTVIEGREPRAPFEIMIGALAAARMDFMPDDVAIGKTTELERRDFTIVGHFSAPGTVYEAELWTRLSDVMLVTKREDASCCASKTQASSKYVPQFAAERVDLEIDAVPEPELMPQLASSLTPIAELALWMAFMAVVACAFACANTMFAAVLARTRERATLRALGYSSTAIAAWSKNRCWSRSLVAQSAPVSLSESEMYLALSQCSGRMTIRAMSVYVVAARLTALL